MRISSAKRKAAAKKAARTRRRNEIAVAKISIINRSPI